MLAAIPDLSQRGACRLLGWSRASLRYVSRGRARDEQLKALLPVLAQDAPREGYRRATDAVRDLVGRIGENTVHRIWKLLKLQVKPRKRKRRRQKPIPELLGLRATGPNQVWCLDFMKDWTLGGRSIRLLAVVDEYTRECLAFVAAPSFKAAEVVALLEWLGHQYGVPAHLRSDNGPEFIATIVGEWAAAVGVTLVLVQHHGIHDPDTGGSYTVKRYASTKVSTGTSEWRHAEIRLEPTNPEFKPIVLKDVEEGEVKVVAEVIEVLR
ncbi:MAG: DDE-type integrase/transposase/recombinase [Candidatus Coatesbacteria bacterium]